MKQCKFFLICLVHVGLVDISYAQKPAFFSDKTYLSKVLKAAEYVYSIKPDSAYIIAEEIEKKWPKNPVVPLIYAEALLWQNIPVLENENFVQFELKLSEVIERAQLLPRDFPAAVFFEMAARGLKAEYFADKGFYIKAINEASNAYSLVKRSMDHTDEFSEFLFAAGVYNYFREVYPEKYPIYKPLIWWFRSGDRKKGLHQLEEAIEKGIITSVEATVYLSYIYLRYENKPELAVNHLKKVVEKYPENYFLVLKYYEALVQTKQEAVMEPPVFSRLQTSTNHYYQLAGHVYAGIYSEMVRKDLTYAFEQYAQAVHLVVPVNHGEQYLAWAYLGAGRILYQKGKKNQAKMHFEKAGELAETKELKKEVDDWISKY